MIVFDCPSCRAELESELEYAGETMDCPSCGHPVVVPAGAIAQGSMIAGYRVERHLGGGCLGEVYVATQLSVERRVALKLLPPSLAHHHPHLAEAFIREARTLARIELAGVVPVLDAGAASGCFYLAAPLVEGEDLDHRLARNGRLPEQEAVHVALETARILAACWDKYALAHLDLKPANLMIDQDGHVRLVDLGLTGKMFSDPATSSFARSCLVSPYVSPEQLEGRTDIDFRSDLYSLGVCLYHLVTGRAPYPEKSADELAAHILNKPLPPAREVQPAISPACEKLINDLTVRAPRLRPASWDRVVEALAGMEQSRTTPGPRRAGAGRRKIMAPSAAAPSHPPAPAAGKVIKLKGGDPHAHHPVTVSSGPSPLPWVLLVLALLGGAGAYFGLKAKKYSQDSAAKMAAEEAASQAAQADEARRRAEDLVQSARTFVDTYKSDVEGGRRQVEAARAEIAKTPYAAALTPALDQLAQVLEERARPTPPPTPAPTEPTGGDTESAPGATNAVTAATATNATAATAAPKPTAAAALDQAAARLLERDYEGAAALLPADGAAPGVDVAALRKELGELPRWADQVFAGLREIIGSEREFKFRDGPRTLVVRSVAPPLVRAEKIVRDGNRVTGRSSSTFRLEDLSGEELISHLHGERGGVSALMCGLAAYRAGRLSDARAWFNRTQSPWAPLLLRAMDSATMPLQ